MPKFFTIRINTFLFKILSGNGVFVNKQKVTKEVLSHNDEILVGKHTLVFMSAEKKPVEQKEQRAAALVEQTILLSPDMGAKMRRPLRSNSPD